MVDAIIDESDENKSKNGTQTKTKKTQILLSSDGNTNENGELDRMLAKSDKAVSTQEMLLDLDSAFTYEAVFNMLIENKMLAMKRDCEDRKRVSRLKRRSLGKVFLSKKFFGMSGRKGEKTFVKSDSYRQAHNQSRAASAPNAFLNTAEFDKLGTDHMNLGATLKDARQNQTTEIISAPMSSASINNGNVIGSQNEDSLTSTISNSSERNAGQNKHNLLVRAQTHTPAERSISIVSEFDNEVCTSTEGERAAHTSTMAESSLTSLRGSVESLSFANANLMPAEAESDKHVKCLHLLEARSISAQNSPILLRHKIKSNENIGLFNQPTAANSLPVTKDFHSASPITATSSIVASRQTLAICINRTEKHNSLGKEQTHNGNYGIDAMVYAATNPHYFSRQNTSEDSANLTLSTLLNQSDSLSLNAPTKFSNLSTTSNSLLTLNGRYKSKSTSLLNNRGSQPISSLNATSRIIALPADASPLDSACNVNSLNRCTAELGSVKKTASTASETKHSTLDKQSMISNTKANGSNLSAAHQINGTAKDVIVSTVNGGALKEVTKSELYRTASTSTGSSAKPTGCCATTVTAAHENDMKCFKPCLPSGLSGSDDDYNHHKRKYKRHHRCSDPVLVYPTPNEIQQCVLNISSVEPMEYALRRDSPYDVQLTIEADKIDDLEKIIPTSRHHHRKLRHHHHKKRHRHRKHKILVQDLDNQVVKVIDPQDLSQRARWTIIATACMLLLMCLMLVGITLRMAPIIDDMVRQENERIKESMERARILNKNLTDSTALLAAQLSLGQQVP